MSRRLRFVESVGQSERVVLTHLSLLSHRLVFVEVLKALGLVTHIVFELDSLGGSLVGLCLAGDVPRVVDH